MYSGLSEYQQLISSEDEVLITPFMLNTDNRAVMLCRTQEMRIEATLAHIKSTRDREDV